MSSFSFLLTPNCPTCRLSSCRVLTLALFSHPCLSSWPHSGPLLQPSNISHHLPIVVPHMQPLYSFCISFAPVFFLHWTFLFVCLPHSLLYSCIMGCMASLQSKAICSKYTGPSPNKPGLINLKDRLHPYSVQLLKPCRCSFFLWLSRQFLPYATFFLEETLELIFILTRMIFCCQPSNCSFPLYLWCPDYKEAGTELLEKMWLTSNKIDRTRKRNVASKLKDTNCCALLLVLWMAHTMEIWLRAR